MNTYAHARLPESSFERAYMVEYSAFPNRRSYWFRLVCSNVTTKSQFGDLGTTIGTWLETIFRQNLMELVVVAWDGLTLSESELRLCMP